MTDLFWKKSKWLKLTELYEIANITEKIACLYYQRKKLWEEKREFENDLKAEVIYQKFDFRNCKIKMNLAVSMDGYI